MSFTDDFIAAFVMDSDNITGQGPKVLFRVWPDGTKSLATPENAIAFCDEYVEKLRAELTEARTLYAHAWAREREAEDVTSKSREEKTTHDEYARHVVRLKWGENEADRLFPDEAAKREGE